MSRTEDLLREALSSTTVDPSADVLHGLDRRIRRARRRAAALAGMAAAAVAAAVAVPIVTVAQGGPTSRHVSITHLPTVPKPQRANVWLTGGARQVATGDDGTEGGGIWALTDGTDTAASADSADVVGFDPATGRVLHRYTVPGPVDYVSVGLGYVWAYGGGDGGSGNLSVIDRVDPKTGHVDTLQIHGKGAPSSMGFASQAAYVTLAVADQVARVSGVGGPLKLSQVVTVPGQPESLTVAMDGTVWVEESLAKKWAHLDVADGHLRILSTVDWPGRIFGLASAGYLWTADSPDRVVELDPTKLSAGVSVAYGDRVRTAGPVSAVVAPTPSGGLYVATSDSLGATPSDETAISYYSPQAARAGGEPTARLANVSSNSLAVTDDGGVVFASDTGSVEYWHP
jgi:sugar lactone lactonase YvrE